MCKAKAAHIDRNKHFYGYYEIKVNYLTDKDKGIKLTILTL